MNSEQQQQRIMGYFIEEAREHLQTIEQGVLNLQDVLNDSESVNELFRAAHSIKGGAAMLGVGSIQHISHRLEDFFKILTEHPQITVDERLKSLLLAGFDPLSELLDQLQGSFKISDQLTTETNDRVKPVFAELEAYLDQLVLDSNGEMTNSTFSQETEDISKEQPEELAFSPESVFQQEVTTKMRDMLQLFRGADTADSRSQLHAICNYFQEIGGNFDLRNWTNLITQIKNAIAQSSNSYRTLAPILIRELKEAQDLVLANRETEVAVSSHLQSLLPYYFSESEDDEVSTIFTTADSDIAIESIEEDFAILEPETTANIEADIAIDLFADQIDEEAFDLAEINESQIDQMSWMDDGEYEISENQHIDGPKVGASELKSLAILFENDDVDFDSAWEDIESNETHMSDLEIDTTIETHDEFADLLSDSSDNNERETSRDLSSEESTMEELFGEFSNDLVVEDNNDSLFPVEDNNDSLFPDDLGVDIIDQISIDPINDLDDMDFSETLDNLMDGGQATENELIDTENNLTSLSSEEYFAELERQENAIAENSFNEASQPFALTFSEEGMTLLEDPFAINESLNEVLLEPSLNIINDEAISPDVDILFKELESDDYTQFISARKDIDTGDTSGLNIFDELGFDTDELDETLKSPEFDVNNSTDRFTNVSSDFSFDENSNSFFADEFADNSSSIVSSSELENSLESSKTNAFESGFGDFPDVDEINSVEGLGDFFGESEEMENTPETVNLEAVNPETVIIDSFDAVDSVNELTSFFESNEEIQSIANESIDFNSFDEEINSVDDLGDFFGDAEESKTISEITDTESFLDEVSGANDLGDLFANEEEPELATNDNYTDEFEQEIDNVDDLGDFFAEEEPEIVVSDNYADGFEQEVNSNDDLESFFGANQNFETVAISEKNELDIFDDQVNNADDLGDFFAAEESGNLAEDVIGNNWEDINTERTISNTSSESNVVDIFEDSFVDFESPEGEDLDSIEIEDEPDPEEDLIKDLFNQVDLSESPDLENLFANVDEDDLTVLDSDRGFDDLDFDEARSLTQNDDINNDDSRDINDWDNMIDDELSDSNLQRLDEHPTSIQQDLDVDIFDITAKTTIDNLVDFFQGDDDSDISLLQNPEELVSDNLEVNRVLEFDEFNQFADLDGERSEISDFSFTQGLESQNLETGNQSQPEELSGIDDNFDFDDLEAMIGNTLDMSNRESNELNGSNNRTLGNYNSQEGSNSSQQSNNEMDFDELEALLGDSDSFDTAVSTSTKIATATEFLEVSSLASPPKLADDFDFDELENMLQSAFAKDVGPIKTKAAVRPPTTARKQRLTDSTMRVDVKYLDSLNNLVGELVVNRNLLEQDQERLQQFITNLLHQVQLLSDVSQRMRDQYDRSLLEASLTQGRGGRSFSLDTSYSSYPSDDASSNSSASSEFEGIEFDRYNTFHVLSQEIIELIVRVRESASDIEFVVGETDQVTRQLGTITTQVQDDLKQSRMVPFAQIADRLPRGIRDRALKTGKQAELEIYGRETLIDKAILEQLTDPLTHLVNNAIDHGLEDPATRQAAGKLGTGKLTVRAYHQGNQTVISISDDGAGISTDKVKKSAVSKRLRTQSEVDQLNDTEVYSLLFEPGFSTAAQADEFKGRGVGLDVVKTCLDDIRGVIIVESEVGKGTNFTIRLPLTLSISKAMFCISDRARVAFPVDGFEDMVEVPQSQIVLNEKGQPCLPWRDTILPFQHLSNLLSYSRYLSRSNIYGKQENDEICIIILRNDTNYLALQVDQFLGEYEIVIKQLEGPIPQPAGIAGATVLGDGRVMAIANVLELFDIASGRLRPSASGMIVQPTVEENVAVDPTVLIVDDSITVRELLSLTFAKVGYRVEQAKDGQDAWEKLRAGLPCDMIFCDIEMPRMDGLDLLSRLQKDARLKEIPVAMLTSRGADRHRQSAIQLGAKGYFTKPYLEEELLSASKRLLAGETLPI